MTDPRLVRYAALICDYSLEIKENHRVLIRSEPSAEPLVLALAEEAWKRGADPSVWLDPPTVADRVLREGNDDQLRHCSPIGLEVMRTFDAAINVLAPTNDRARSTIPPDRQRLHDEGQAELAKLAYERFAVIPWMVCAYPTAAAAQEAQMSTWSYEEFVYRACLLDEPDPAAAWRALAERQRRLCERLTGSREVRIQTAAGTDLTLGVDGQPWESSSGLRNLPDGEVFCSPLRDETNGVVLFDLPSLMYGRRFERVRLRFEAGRVVEATAEAGAEALNQLLDTDEGARRVGEFAIATNEGITHSTGSTLFDEKIGGTFHCALGQAFPNLQGTNESSIHWDLVGDLRAGGSIEADGEAIARDGRLLV
jgi:aminopeptidase